MYVKYFEAIESAVEMLRFIYSFIYLECAYQAFIKVPTREVSVSSMDA